VSPKKGIGQWVSFTSSFETAASRPPQDEVKPKLEVLILRSVALATRLEGWGLG